MISFDSIVFALVIFYLCYRLIKFWLIDPWLTHRAFWSQGIPGYYTPILGDILPMRRAVLADDPTSHDTLMEKKYGSYYHASFGPTVRLILSDPLAIHAVLKTNARAYHKTRFLRLILGDIFGNDNLVLAEDDIHRQHRSLIAPLFQNQNVYSMLSLMIEMTNVLLDKWTAQLNHIHTANQSLSLDLNEEMSCLSLDIVSGCIFGGGLMDDGYARQTICQNVIKTMHDLEQRVFNLIGLIPIINQLPLASRRRIDRAKHTFRTIVQTIIEQRKKGLSKSACKGMCV